MYSKDVAPTEEQIVSFLKDAVASVEKASEQDVQDFNAIKKLYKQSVPFSRRKYVAAWLVKQALSSRSRYNHERPSRFDNRHERSEERQSRFEQRERPVRAERSERPERQERSERAERTERTERPPRVQIDPSMAETIFIGIGRNRRVFPRDLVGLSVSVAGLDRERIGDIRVLTNYSFIQLFKEDCDKVINALNGYDYRGRKLAVNISRRREEGEDESEPAVAASEPEQQQVLSEETNATPVAEPVVVDSEVRTSSVSSGDSSSSQSQYSETTDDGQVKSHFGTGAAY